MPQNKSWLRLSTVNGVAARRYASIAEAAEYISCNPATIRVMLADGRLTKYSLGPRVLRVDLNEIDAIMAAGA